MRDSAIITKEGLTLRAEKSDSFSTATLTQAQADAFDIVFDELYRARREHNLLGVHLAFETVKAAFFLNHQDPVE